MKALADRAVWFVTGSQRLYGDEALRLIAAPSGEIAAALDATEPVPVRVVVRPVVTSPAAIEALS